MTAPLQARLEGHQDWLDAFHRVRIVDAHPPRKVVTAYREVSRGLDVERYRNEAAGVRRRAALAGKAEAESIATRGQPGPARSDRESREKRGVPFCVRRPMPSTPSCPRSVCSENAW